MPGVVVTEEERGWRRSTFVLLADPLVGDVPSQLAKEYPSAAVNLEVQSYRSLDPEVMVAAVTARFATIEREPDPPVCPSVEGGVLKAEGAASHRWLKEAHRLMPSLGITAFDFSGLVDQERQTCEKLSREIASISVMFLPNQAKVPPDEAVKWRHLAQGIRALVGIADGAGLAFECTLFGDRLQAETSALLSFCQERREVARGELIAQGLPAESLRVGGWLPPTLTSSVSLSQSITVVPSFLLSRKSLDRVR
ncbi:MAG: hypothetical protein ACKVHP_01735 [Verrucomicrobiales bacterium]